MFFTGLSEPNEGEKWKNHNIMCLVGNGFDIGALLRINKDHGIRHTGFGPNVLSKYEDFYRYLQFSTIVSSNNTIYRKMQEKEIEAAAHDKSWSNFEGIVDELVFGDDWDESRSDAEKLSEINEIEKSLREMQYAFSSFLYKLLPSEKLQKFDEIVRDKNFAIGSLQGFMKDVAKADGENLNIGFPTKVNPNDHLNFLFVDFNYTMLLDSYINLDRQSFNVKQYKSSDNNFFFFPDPNQAISSIEKADYVSSKSWWAHRPIRNTQILTHVVHPHGIQDAPGSILFGTEDYRNIEDARWKFLKNLWARDSEKYKKDFEKTNLFIIFGMSVSFTDGWWMTEIYRRLLTGAELIIYNFNKELGETSAQVKERFKDACIYLSPEENSDFDRIQNKIYIVDHNGQNNCFLGFNGVSEPITINPEF